MSRFGYIAATYVMAIGVTPFAFLETPTKLIWNASASVPIGLYSVQPTGRPMVGDVVAVRPPDALSSFLADRGYLPLGVPLLKRVLGTAGHTVCRDGQLITLDGVAVGVARRLDRLDRELPVWTGCRAIAADELFLMSWDAPESFDGRYFGPLPASAVIGRATAVWTDEFGDGRFEWRASQH